MDARKISPCFTCRKVDSSWPVHKAAVLYLRSPWTSRRSALNFMQNVHVGVQDPHRFSEEYDDSKGGEDSVMELSWSSPCP